MLKYCKAFVKIFLDNQKLGLKVVFPWFNQHDEFGPT